MSRLFVCLFSLSLIAFNAHGACEDSIVELEKVSQYTELKKSSKEVSVIEFYAPYCEGCAVVDAADEKIAEFHSCAKPKIYRVNVENDGLIQAILGEAHKNSEKNKNLANSSYYQVQEGAVVGTSPPFTLKVNKEGQLERFAGNRDYESGDEQEAKKFKYCTALQEPSFQCDLVFPQGAQESERSVTQSSMSQGKISRDDVQLGLDLDSGTSTEGSKTRGAGSARGLR